MHDIHGAGTEVADVDNVDAVGVDGDDESGDRDD